MIYKDRLDRDCIIPLCSLSPSHRLEVECRMRSLKGTHELVRTDCDGVPSTFALVGLNGAKIPFVWDVCPKCGGRFNG